MSYISPTTNIDLVFRAMRRVNAAFDLFCQFTGRAAGFHMISFFYLLMLTRGPEFSRCQVWRVYASLVAEAVGDHALAQEALTWSDDALLEALRELGITV